MEGVAYDSRGVAEEGMAEECIMGLTMSNDLEMDLAVSLPQKPPLESRQLFVLFNCLPTAPAPETNTNATTGSVPTRILALRVASVRDDTKMQALIRQPPIIQPAPTSEQWSWNELPSKRTLLAL
ncbi:hypothetical protein M405DRAFT_867817 [Rhizopogon salebrosus TDB-379]|nr:hypothetical protein M405DRAFT_867817 [Rhizopogon salebrosus TDB-379]